MYPSEKALQYGLAVLSQNYSDPALALTNCLVAAYEVDVDPKIQRMADEITQLKDKLHERESQLAHQNTGIRQLESQLETYRQEFRNQENKDRVIEKLRFELKELKVVNII